MGFFYFRKTPGLIQSLFPQVIWRIRIHPKTIFLTFDDGPSPESSEWILDTLSLYEINASFFCLGCQVEKYPMHFQKITDDGNIVGNHGYAHISGWLSSSKNYLDDFEKAYQIIKSPLFRPAFGHIPWFIMSNLSQRCRIVMWDVLPGDFDLNLSMKECLQQAIKHSAEGSIIVFHDKPQCIHRLQYILPKYLDHFLSKGYTFKRLVIEDIELL